MIEFSAEPRPISLDVEMPADYLGEIPGEDLEGRTVLYIMVPRWVSTGQIDTLVNLLDEQYRVSADMVVFRIHPQRHTDFLGSTGPEDLAERFPGIPVLALTWDGAFRCDQLGGPVMAHLGSICRPLEPVLRHAEIRAMLDRSGVILPVDDTFHYEGPSGEHYDSFVRVGTAIQSIDSLDGLAFWLLPWLMRHDAIVLDSWTIMSLGLHCARYLDEAEGSRVNAERVGPEDRHSIGAIECQRRYGEPAGQLQQRLSSLRGEQGTRTPRALVIMSASSTGDSAAGLVSVCEKAGFGEVEALSLLGPEDGAGTHFCQLEEITQHWPEAECPRCEERSSRVRVMRDTYLLDLSASVQSEVAIRLPHVQLARDFFGRYAGGGAVSVHRNQEDDERHHMIYMDIDALLSQSAFIERLEERCRSLEQIDLVLCPEHTAGSKLAERVSSLLGAPCMRANPERLPDMDGEEAAGLKGARRILVVDDIVMTGTRMRRYRNALHRAGVAREGFELHFLAGVARPADLLSLQGVIDYAHGAEHFHHVELLILPNWGWSQCPWCIERQMIESHGAMVSDGDRLEARLAALNDTTAGLTGDLFLNWLPGDIPSRSPWELGPESIFNTRDECELFAAVAHAVQVLRSNGELNEAFTLPVGRILDRRLTFTGRYYDTAITAAILRATRRHDLRSTSTDRDLEQDVESRLKDAPHVALHAELLFALARHHVPGRGLDAVATALAQGGAEPGVRQLFELALSA